MLIPFTISFEEACGGVHVKKILTISHRWMSREIADVDGAQLTAIKKHLTNHGDDIEYVWVDYSCATSGKEDTRAGRRLLADDLAGQPPLPRHERSNPVGPVVHLEVLDAV